MSTPAYINIQGTTQGHITENAFTPDSVGNVYVEGHENEILAQEIKHQITVPTDPQSGQPTGQRVHKPFIFTCSLNRAMPLIYGALATGEILKQVTVKWYRTSLDAKQEHFFTTTLNDAIVVDITTRLPQVLDQENGKYTQLIDVSLAYREIKWVHEAASSAGGDNWRKPKSD